MANVGIAPGFDQRVDGLEDVHAGKEDDNGADGDKETVNECGKTHECTPDFGSRVPDYPKPREYGVKRDARRLA